MMHLELPDISMIKEEQELKSIEQIKEELEQIKEELPGFKLSGFENFRKHSFYTNSDTFNDLELPLSPTITSSEELPFKHVLTPRKNRRKALQPQRAIHSEGSLENSSECSQEDIGGRFLNILDLVSGPGSLMSDGENDIELPDDDLLQDIDEENIFKGLQEETNGEKIDEELLGNAKEEWRAHWGMKCNMCEQVFAYRHEFDQHYLNNYGLPAVYTCSFCNKTAEKYSTFRSHCYRHITEGRFKCHECPRGFSLSNMLQVHITAKHTKAKPFSCEECGRCFVTKPGLKIHIKKHKIEAKEDYPCVECGKILHTRGGLTSHMNVHRLGRRFMCDVCGKTFTQKVNMQQHVKQHTGDKPHICDQCGKTFAERSHLARHYSFHSNIRPFQCNICQKMYKTERCLKVHSLVHAAARPFVCTYCNKGFLSSTKLKQHQNIHTGERPYKCNYCERTFTNYPNWLKHTRRRHKVDHKTGKCLTEKVPKTEVIQNTELAPVPMNLVVPPSETADSGLVDFISLQKSEELMLQQGLISLPSNIDDRVIIPQQLDILAGTGTSFGSYLQMQIPVTSGLLQSYSYSTSFSDIVFPSLIPYTLQSD